MQIHEATPFDLIMNTMTAVQSRDALWQKQALTGLAGVLGRERAAALLETAAGLSQQPAAQMTMPPVAGN
jgi:hypothetical protein